MKKTLLTIVCAIVVSMYTMPVLAAVGSTFTVETLGGPAFTVKVTSENGTDNTVQIGNGSSPAIASDYSSAVSIPETVTRGAITYRVTALAAKAFYNCAEITAVTLPSSLTTIGEKAFLGCKQLAQANIPSSVQTIDAFAFSGCSKLKTLNVVGSNAIACLCSINYGGDSAHPLNSGGTLKINGSDVTSITIPSEVQGVNYLAFYKCQNITEINFASGSQCTFIGQKAFLGCNSLTKVSIPSSINEISTYAFSGTAITEINVLGANDNEAVAAWCGITYGSESANPLNTGAALKINGNAATDITIPNTVTEIKDFAFYKCANLETVDFANASTCEKLGQKAFLGCGNLKQVTIPSSITEIGASAFSDCGMLSGNYVNITGNTDKEAIAAWCGITFNNISANPMYNGCSLRVNGNEVTNLIVPNTAERIANFAFYNCAQLQTVGFEENPTCTVIGERAFINCSGITAVAIPSSVTEIGEFAFTGCNSLVTVNLTGSSDDEAIAAWCGTTFKASSANPLYMGSNLQVNGTTLPNGNLVIPSGVNEISNFAFHNCNNIETVTIPASVTTIGYSFQNCTNLTNVYCMGAPASIAASAFSGIGYENMTLHAPLNNLGGYINDTNWSKFINVMVDAVNESENYTNENAFANATNNIKVNYLRKFKNTNWQALFVPFDMKYEDFCDNFSIAAISGGSDANIAMTHLTEGETMEAGVPYFIKAKTADSNNDQTITATVTQLRSCNDVDPLDIGNYIFTGTYSIMQVPTGSYAMAGGSLRRAGTNTQSYLSAFRWYMTAKDANVKADVISLILDDETAINKIAEVAEEGEWYNLSGQRIAQPTKRGIYIKNGKKIMF